VPRYRTPPAVKSAASRARYPSPVALERPFVRSGRLFTVNVMTSHKRKPMSSLDFDLDEQMSSLELEWRKGYEASIAARAAYQTLAGDRNAKADMLDAARERLDRAEAVKARVMAKIERLEDQILSRD
jgi:hypothetical protein